MDDVDEEDEDLDESDDESDESLEADVEQGHSLTYPHAVVFLNTFFSNNYCCLLTIPGNVSSSILDVCLSTPCYPFYGVLKNKKLLYTLCKRHINSMLFTVIICIIFFINTVMRCQKFCCNSR